MSLLSVALVAVVAATPVLAANLKIVAPPDLASAEGDDSVHPASGSRRIQHLFLASEFAGVPATNTHILSWNMRADRSQSQAVDWTFPNEQIWMSTTSITSLTNNFASNRGAGMTLVFDGASSFSFSGGGPAGGPRDFGAGLQLQSPFRYDPTQGNLLVELLRIGDYAPATGVTLDLHTTVGVATLVTDAGKQDSATGITTHNKPVVQFEFGVPEPSTLALAGLALACAMPRSRKR
jgi:hypothetical protein